MRRALLAFLPLGLWAAAVLFLGTVEAAQATLPYGMDKVAHAITYGIGGVLAAWAGRKQRHAAAAWGGLLLVLVTGVVDEVRQRGIPHRTADPFDWLADAVGALIAFLLADRFLRKG